MVLNPILPSDETLSGTGAVHRGEELIATVKYTIHVSATNGQATVVTFEPKPSVRNGDLLHLTLEDGRVLNCHILDKSPYGAVVGDDPIFEQRRHIR